MKNTEQSPSLKVNNKIRSYREAFMTSPGPDSPREALILSLKGLCMGSADIIPGVSGGTIALITGIYENLIGAIRSVDLSALKKVLQLDLKGALAGIHLRFLLFLLMGIGTAILSLARLMNYLLMHQPVLIWSLFFGLITASILVVGQKVEKWSAGPMASFAIGTTAAWIIVGLIPVTTPEALWFIFLSGFIAICAMILPGLSGAFLLLILGKYEYITGTLKNPFDLNNIIIIGVFCCGCVAGLLSFSRVLHYLLTKWHTLTLAFLTGLMAGSMRKIWPWKEVLQTQIIRGKVHILSTRNILPDGVNRELATAIALMGVGFIIVIILERLSRKAP